MSQDMEQKGHPVMWGIIVDEVMVESGDFGKFASDGGSWRKMPRIMVWCADGVSNLRRERVAWQLTKPVCMSFVMRVHLAELFAIMKLASRWS